ncbi:MAG: hypothetical protein OWR52_02230 [Acidibacillus sp.]|nr:hypothetical protein [Acidibacillus sp.]
MKKQLGLLAALIVLVGVGYGAVHTVEGQTKATAVAASLKAPTAIAPLTLTDVNGQTIAVNPNNKTVLHFMMSTCADCIGMEKSLTKFAHSPGVQIISLDVDPENDNLSTIQDFKKITGATWNYVLLKNSALINKYHVTELDTVVVLYHNKVIYDGVSPSVSTLKQVLV